MPWSNPNGFLFTNVGILLNAPTASGVYALYNNERWIYIGESGNIQERLLQHFNGDNACITGWRPPSFSFELWPWNRRVARQDQLILELRPACNQRLG